VNGVVFSGGYTPLYPVVRHDISNSFCPSVSEETEDEDEEDEEINVV